MSVGGGTLGGPQPHTGVNSRSSLLLPVGGASAGAAAAAAAGVGSSSGGCHPRASLVGGGMMMHSRASIGGGGKGVKGGRMSISGVTWAKPGAKSAMSLALTANVEKGDDHGHTQVRGCKGDNRGFTSALSACFRACVGLCMQCPISVPPLPARV
jgi:hypothetical protein